MRIAAVQFAPSFLDTAATLEQMLAAMSEAANAGASLVAFPETALSGYPGWLSPTGGAAFDDSAQKHAYAHYVDAAVEADGPEVARLAEAARDLDLHLVTGLIERGSARGRGSTWAGLLQVSRRVAPSIHRKLVPTFEERLVWSAGDANELRTHPLGRDFRVGALNCWENWMPLARAALYEQGEDVHVSVWPGSPELTRDISRFTAREGRVLVVAASGVLQARDIPDSFPLKAAWLEAAEGDFIHSGGTRIVSPTGADLVALDEPVEGIAYADLDPAVLRSERQNFDPAGHYSRPDLLRLEVVRGTPR
ncbi:MAG: carbon-nitrogen hydrolase family protein [Planctomycetota bacterium]